MSNTVPESINQNKMNEEKFNEAILKGYKEMLEGKGRNADNVFEDILSNDIETKLDEADLQAKTVPMRYAHGDVFPSIRKIIQVK